MEFVLVGLECVSCYPNQTLRSHYLEISKLRKLLSTVVQFAGERLDLLMNDLVGSDVATLSKGLATDLTPVGPLSSMSPLVSLLWSATEGQELYS